MSETTTAVRHKVTSALTVSENIQAGQNLTPDVVAILDHGNHVSQNFFNGHVITCTLYCAGKKDART
jgi:hypothetical protein